MSNTSARQPVHQSWLWLLLASFLLLMVVLTNMAPVAEPGPQLIGFILCVAAVLLAVMAGRGDSPDRRVSFWMVVGAAAFLWVVEVTAVVRLANRPPRSMPGFVMTDAEVEHIRRREALYEQFERETAWIHEQHER